MALYLTEAEVGELLTMDMALEAVEEVFIARAAGEVVNHPRQRIHFRGGSYHLMAAGWPDRGIAGSKSYVAGRNGTTFQVLLYGTGGEGLLAVIDANVMGQVRTGAATGIATRYMARWCEPRVAVIGSGFQARTQLEAIAKVREATSAAVYSRSPERREQFAREMTERLEFAVEPADSAEACVDGADIVAVITSARDPVLLGDWVKDGMHINAAGANGWSRRELDTRAVAKCDVIATDDVDQAKIECADLMAPVEAGHIRWEQVLNLGDVVTGRLPGRTEESDITLFESQGVAMEDIAVAHRLLQLARERGVGTELNA